jgi:hypothetical protein
MTLLSTTTLSGATTTISVSSTGYVDLQIEYLALTPIGNHLVEFDSFTSYRILQTENRNGSRYTSTSNTGILYLNGLQENSGNGTTNSGVIRIHDVNSSNAKTGELTAYYDRQGDPTLTTISFAFNSAGPIESVKFKNNNSFNGGTVKIYGVK